MSEPDRCPYCNQPLASSAAVKHLHREEEKLRDKLFAEAKAAAASKVKRARAAAEKKVRAELEGERSKHERSLQRTVEKLQRQNEDLERQLEGLSAPDRGDMNEADIAHDLIEAFPDDEITRKGKGGDIVQSVRYQADHKLERAGVILYECKDTKRWSNGFIKQIKADGRKLQTPYLLLVSRALPAKEKDVCVREDVVVADPLHARHMARVLRRMAIETHRAELAGRDRAGKTSLLYEYLRGDDFREQLATVVEAGNKLSEMLVAERRQHERDWERRQRTYDDVTHSSVAIEQAIQDIIENEPRPQRTPTSRRTRTARAKRRRSAGAAH